MRADRPVTTAVIIPARNEERRVAGCLRALAGQDAGGVGVVLVANNCGDGTARVARDVAKASGLRLEVLELVLGAGTGVGTARWIGSAFALTVWPEVANLLTTDADCLPAPDWIARNRFHLARVAAVCGSVEPMESELSVLNGMEVESAEMEGRYEKLVMDFYRLFRPGPWGLEGDHGAAAGASLAVRADAYRAIGGFRDLAIGEDRDLVRRLKDAGFGVLHAGDVRVAASCRLEGRAKGGMAGALRARAERSDYVIDEALPPARTLVDAAFRGELGPWPLQVAPQDRLRARDLAPHIVLLEEALRTLRTISPHVPARRVNTKSRAFRR
jgi:GT2 family glycosyltransferase